MNHILSNHSSIDGYLGYVHVLAVVNSIIMNLGLQISLQYTDFIFSGYIPSSGISRSRSSPFLNFLKDLSVLFSIMVILIDVSLYPHQQLLSFVFLIIIILRSAKWYLVILICVSLMISDAEHFFIHTHMSFVCLLLRKIYSVPYPIFIELLAFPIYFRY
jgi:hypothetical protein